MGRAVFPPCYLTWGQTMAEVMKIMATSFKRSHAHTATLSDLNPAAGHYWATLPLETPGHSWASLGQTLVGSLLLYPGSWCAQVSVCAIQKSISQSCISSGDPVVALRWPSSQRAYAIPRSTAPESLTLRQSTADPYLLGGHLNTVLSQSVWVLWVLVCKECLSPPSISGGYGVWF